MIPSLRKSYPVPMPSTATPQSRLSAVVEAENKELGGVWLETAEVAWSREASAVLTKRLAVDGRNKESAGLNDLVQGAVQSSVQRGTFRWKYPRGETRRSSSHVRTLFLIGRHSCRSSLTSSTHQATWKHAFKHEHTPHTLETNHLLLIGLTLDVRDLCYDIR